MTGMENENVTGKSAPRNDLSIVLVCWNNRDYLAPCLHSLYAEAMQATFDVVVVDNGSTDGSIEMLAQEFPRVRVIQNTENVGLSRASNQGILATDSRYVLLLNNDTLVNAHTFDRMIEFLDTHPDAGAVGGELLNPDGSFQSGYASFSSLPQEFLIATGLGDRLWSGYPSHGRADRVKRVDWLSSACLMLRRSVLDRVGLLDEQYFVYGDEADLQFRIKKANWQVYYMPDASIIHYGGRSMNRWRRRRLVYRGKLLFYLKCYSAVQTFGLRMLFGALTFGKTVAWSAALVVPGRQSVARQELRSNLDVLRLCWRLE